MPQRGSREAQGGPERPESPGHTQSDPENPREAPKILRHGPGRPQISPERREAQSGPRETQKCPNKLRRFAAQKVAHCEGGSCPLVHGKQAGQPLKEAAVHSQDRLELRQGPDLHQECHRKVERRAGEVPKRLEACSCQRLAPSLVMCSRTTSYWERPGGMGNVNNARRMLVSQRKSESCKPYPWPKLSEAINAAMSS